MPQFAYKIEQIIIPVNDRIFNDTIIKQKAIFHCLNHTQTEITSSVKIEAMVHQYANDNGDYGLELTGKGFAPYKVIMAADNDTIVDVTDGTILEVRNGETDDMWKAKAATHAKMVMFQADFFVMMRDTSPMKIGDLLKWHILNANALGRFN